VTLSDMSDSVFTAPTHSNASNIRWFNLIVGDDNYIGVDYFTVMVVYLHVLASGCKYYSCIN
jgi:hypothetical protein